MMGIEISMAMMRKSIIPSMYASRSIRSPAATRLRDSYILRLRRIGDGYMSETTASYLLHFILHYPTEFDSLVAAIRRDLATEVAEQVFDEATK